MKTSQAFSMDIMIAIIIFIGTIFVFYSVIYSKQDNKVEDLQDEASIVLQNMCNTMCKERKAKFFIPENQYLVDNGVMIAWLGILMKKIAKKNYKSIDIKPYERTDDIRIG